MHLPNWDRYSVEYAHGSIFLYCVSHEGLLGFVVAEHTLPSLSLLIGEATAHENRFHPQAPSARS